MNNSKIWLVTGASKGLGLSLVQKLLAKGYKVAATSRKMSALTEALGEATDNFLPLQVDIIDEDSVLAAILQTKKTFGRIDVVVNNAGYGQTGALEELTDKEARNNFDVNVFGLLNVIRNVMPAFRHQQSGHIFNIASIGGYYGGFPGWGIYCATKFAVAGLTESLAAEAKEFGISATVVYPGYFRTNFLASDSLQVASKPIDAYASARQSEKQHQEEINGNQPGDPDKAAEVMIMAAESSNPPVHLLLGTDAHNMAGVKQSQMNSDVAAWKEHAMATDLS